ncbi:hypothetical protein ASG81_11220 [Paenibacillus sp. Soil522]|nr:hypothetical protein ASG81_11220 [Paenibacillus sp. Soil522]
MVLDEPGFSAYNRESLIYHVLVYTPCGKYTISNDEDEVLRALLIRERMDQLQPSPKSLFYELTSELFP